MEFLVEITIKLPADMPAQQRAALLDAELTVGRRLAATGAIDRMWRVPGARRNVGIWQASDATHLHELVSSLPLFDWIEATVTALAAHPVTTSDADSGPAV